MQVNNERKNTYVAQYVCASRCIKTTSAEVFFFLVRNYLFLKNYVTSEGAVSHTVLYYQQLSITRYQLIC